VKRNYYIVLVNGFAVAFSRAVDVHIHPAISAEAAAGFDPHFAGLRPRLSPQVEMPEERFAPLVGWDSLALQPRQVPLAGLPLLRQRSGVLG
jgi:hypothetical protein